MKTSQIARGIVGALSLAGVMGMVGCGAGYEDESTAEAEIGSTSQALTSVAALASPANDIPSGIRFAGSCKIHDPSNSRDYLLVGGGFNFAGTPAAQSALYKYDPVAATWTTLAQTLTAGRGHLIAIQNPQAPEECMFGPGSTALVIGAASTVATTDVVRIDGSGNFSVTAQTGGALGTTRAKYAMQQCGSSKVILTGGQTGTAASNRIDVFTFGAGAGGAWSQLTNGGTPVTLLASVKEPAIASDANHEKIMIAGGDTLAAASRQVRLLEVSSACAFVDQGGSATGLTLTSGSVARPTTQAVAFPVAATVANATNAFAVAGGDSTATASTPLNLVSNLQLNFTASPPTILDVSADTALGTATRKPKLLSIGSQHFVTYGEDNSGTSSSINSVNVVQEYVAGSAWLTATGTSRVAHVVENIGGLGYAASGESSVNGTKAAVVKTDLITP